MPPLLHRRHVWLPTLWGWLLLLVGGAVLLAAAAFGVAGFLAVQEPARGPGHGGARTLVVEGWLERDDLDQAIAAFRRGRYERVLTTGGPIESWQDAQVSPTYAERAAGYLNAQGLGAVPAIAVPAPATLHERTYLSALMVRDWAGRNGIPLEAIDLYSRGVHARRSRMIYRLALGPAVEVGVLAAAPSGARTERWWSRSDETKAVVGEALGLIWTVCCFWPPAARD